MKTELIIIGILFIVPSVLYFFFPDFFLTFGSKWKYKDATPSDAARMVGNITAVICILIGVGMIIYGVFYNYIDIVFNYNMVGEWETTESGMKFMVQKVTW